jgi:hypothetical protein
MEEMEEAYANFQNYSPNTNQITKQKDFIPYINMSNEMEPISINRQKRIGVLNALAESKLKNNEKTLLANANQIGHKYNKEICFNNIKEKVIINPEGKVQIVQIFV